MKSFRYKKSMRVPQEWQGLIYFQCRLYAEMDAETRKRIRTAAGRAGGDYTAALLEYVTTADTADSVAARHYISVETLMRATNKFYELMFDSLLCTAGSLKKPKNRRK